MTKIEDALQKDLDRLWDQNSFIGSSGGERGGIHSKCISLSILFDFILPLYQIKEIIEKDYIPSEASLRRIYDMGTLMEKERTLERLLTIHPESQHGITLNRIDLEQWIRELKHELGK